MMSSVRVENLTFTFPDDWQVSKYDDWSYYRNQFARMWSGIKAVDLLALDGDHTAWLIEVKDYRQHPRTKPTGLADEIARKTFDTLAAMLPGSLHANDEDERIMAKRITQAQSLRIVLHLEQPAKHSTLRPRAIDPAAVKGRLKALLKPIDAHPMVVASNSLGSLSWIVT